MISRSSVFHTLAMSITLHQSPHNTQYGYFQSRVALFDLSDDDLLKDTQLRDINESISSVRTKMASTIYALLRYQSKPITTRVAISQADSVDRKTRLPILGSRAIDHPTGSRDLHTPAATHERLISIYQPLQYGKPQG